MQKPTEIQELIDKMKAMFKARDWGQFHSPKNLSMNLAVEVGELLEHFRWVTEEQSAKLDKETLEEVESEIADVFLNLLYLANSLGIDPIAATHKKLAVIDKKYPAKACKGKCDKYTKYEQ